MRTPTPWFLALPTMAWLLGAGCAPPPEDVPEDALGECDAEGASELYVIQQLWFVRETDGVVADGFDLDGDVSAPGGPGGCGVGDYVAEDGTAGIDNAFAGLLPALELTEAAAVESLIAQAIADGDLLISMELDELDDPMDDACVDVALGRAAGVPMLGTDGLILSGQTFDRDDEAPGFLAEDQSLQGGTLVSPLELVLPVQVFEVQLQFVMTGGQMRVDRHDDGTVGGVFSGSVETASILDVLIDNDDVLYDGTYDVLANLLSLWADMNPDEAGTCQSLSMSFGFEAVPAFYFE